MSRKGETGSEASSPAPGDRGIVVSPCGRRLPSAYWRDCRLNSQSGPYCDRCANVGRAACPDVRDEPEPTSRQAHLELMNRGDWRQAAAFFAPDVPHRSGNWQTGTEAVFRGKTLLTDNLKDIFRTFPDWKLEIVEMVAEGDSVLVRCRVSGTHRGVAARAVNGGFLVGVQPTGKHFEVQHIQGAAHSLVQGSRWNDHGSFNQSG
jgi:predicted ester cyclase